MSSSSSGHGEIFWHEQGVTQAYLAERSVDFDAKHDGEGREYAIEFTPTNPVQGIRIDPSRDAGAIRLSNIRLTTKDGKVIHRFTP